MSHETRVVFTNLFIGGLRISEQGQLQAKESVVIAPKILDDSERRKFAEDAGTENIEGLFMSAAALAHRAGFRVAIQNTLHSTANYPALTADEWVERLSHQKSLNGLTAKT